MASKVKPWAMAKATDIALSNARIIDPESGSVSAPSSVWLSEGKIKAISSQKHTAFKDGPDAIDLKGKYICPGLIDCHVHLTASPGATRVQDIWDAHPQTLAYRTAWAAKQMLLRGFTTARDNGGATFALRDAISEGLIPGPRLFLAGKALSQTGGHGDLRQPHHDDSVKCCAGNDLPGFARVCDGVPECLAAARDELRMGANHLKIMVGGGVASPVDPLHMIQFTPEEIRAITQTAANLGTYVTAHAYTDKTITLAIENGVKGIEHANFISKHVALRCAEKGVVVTPTLSTYHAMISGDFLPESGRQKCQEVLESGVSSLKILHEAGVRICFGTDLLANMHEHQNGEFRLRAEGLSKVEILKSATINAAKLLNMDGKLGVVKEGAFADLLILDSDPLEDLATLADIQDHCFGIIKEGRVVSSRLVEDGLKIDSVYRSA